MKNKNCSYITKSIHALIAATLLAQSCLSTHQQFLAMKYESTISPEVWNYRGTDELNYEFADEVCDILGIDNIADITNEDLLRIDKLDLSGKGIKEIPYALNLFKNLDSLIVDDNNIGYIHNDITDTLEDLDYFSICNNYLIDVDNTLLREFGIDSFKYNILEENYQYNLEVDPTIDLNYLTAVGDGGEEYLREVTSLVLDDTEYSEDVITTTTSNMQVYNSKPENVKEIPNIFEVKVNKIDVSDTQIIDYFGIDNTMIEQYSELHQLESQDEALNKIVEKYRTENIGLEVYLELKTYEVVGVDTEVIGNVNSTTHQAIEVTTPQAMSYNVTTDSAIDIGGSFQEVIYNLITEENIVRSRSLLAFSTLNGSDTIPPVILGVTQSTNDWTNSPVTITVDAQDYGIGSDGSVLVSFDGGAFSSNKSLTVTTNRSVAIKVKDKVGNEVALNYSVKNIDKDKPLAPTVNTYVKDTGKPVSQHTNAKGWVNKVVTVEATNRDAARGGNTQAPIDYMFIQLSDGTRIQEDDVDRAYLENINDTISCGYIDKAGNVSALTPVGSFKIDTEKPKILNYTTLQGVGGGCVTQGYVRISDYSDNMSKDLEYTVDNKKTWHNITHPNVITEYVIQPTTFNMYLRDQAGNISDVKTASVNAVDGIKPILTGYRLEPSTWTNGNVKIYPVGDHTGSKWWNKTLNGVTYDSWSNVGYILATNNFQNYPMRFSDWAGNWADNTVMVTVSNIDKELPYLDNVQVVNKGNGTCDVIINGADDLSGIHTTQGYSINGSSFGTSNKINIPISSTEKTINYVIQDKATNKYSSAVVIRNGIALGAPAVATTNRTFEKWGNKDHTISLSGGYSPNGISHYEYRIKTIRNGLGETVNTYTNWTRYTQPFVISQEGEMLLETRIVPKTGTDYVYGSEKVWLDKTKPSSPIVDTWNIIDGVKVPYKPSYEPCKFTIHAYPTNFYTADNLSGVEFISTRVVNDQSVSTNIYSPKTYSFSFNGSGNRFYYFDKAGNYSKDTFLGSNGVGYKPYVVSMQKNTSDITDKPVEIVFKFKDDYYNGFNSTPVSKIYTSLPYTDTFLNSKPNSADYIEWFNTSPNVNTNKVKTITHTVNISKNGTYYLYVRDYDDLVSYKSFTIDNIDLENPVIKSVNVSNTKPTNGTVTIMVDATDDCHPELLQYSFDGGSTYTSTNSIVVSNNQVVKVRVKDGFGRVTAYNDINVNNIDKDKPTIKSIDTSRVNATDVKFKVVVEDVGTAGLADNFLAFNDGAYGTKLEYITKYNTSTKISAIDKAGNVAETFISVSQDDAVMIVPDIKSTVANGSWTTENVRVYIDGGVMPSGLKGYEYSVNNGTWQPYNSGTGIEIDKDGIYTIKARALGLGGEVGAESNTYTIKLDSTPPTFTTSLSNTGWTNQNISLTVNNASDGSGIGLHEKPYSFDGVNWVSSNTYTVSENKLYYIKVRDALGNVSTIKSVPVNNIDKVKPTITGIVSAKFEDGTDFDYQAGGWANKSVIVTLDIKDVGSGIARTEFDNGPGWLNTGSINSLRYDTVGTVAKFRTYDKAGNVSDIYTAPLIKVDISVPTIKSVVGYENDWYKTTTLTVTPNTPSSWLAPITHYSFDGGNSWQTSNTKEITKSGTYDIKVKNEAGTESATTSVKVNIDSVTPVIQSVTGSPTAWTNKDVTLTVTATDESSGLHAKPYSFDDGRTWQSSNTKTFTENQTVNIKVRDKMGNIVSKSEVISKIDKKLPTAPTIKVAGTPFESETFTITNATDENSGVKSVEYKIGNAEWKLYENKPVSITDTNPNTIIQARVTDNAGNISTSSITVNIVLVDVEIPLQLPITVSPESNKTTVSLPIVNKGTPISVELAIDDSKGIPLTTEEGIVWNELTTKETKSKAQMILSVAEGQNLLYDGYANNKVLTTDQFKLADMRNGKVVYNIDLYTGSSWDTDLAKSYDLRFVVRSKY